MQAPPIDSFAARIQVLQAESERIKQYLHDLPEPALRQPSACTDWQVQDVIAHLIGVAETYAGSILRGLSGDTSPPPGRRPAGEMTGALAAEGIAQRSIAARQALGDQLLASYDAANDQLNERLAGLAPEQRTLPCYHPGGIVNAQNFADLRLKELALHEWDIRSSLEPAAELAPACLPAILTTIAESIASGSLRWAFWSGPSLPTAVRYRFALAGQQTSDADLVVAGNTLRQEPAATGTPDVTLHCDAETFILLVYGRLDLDRALASGRLSVTGDQELARAFGQWFRGI